MSVREIYLTASYNSHTNGGLATTFIVVSNGVEILKHNERASSVNEVLLLGLRKAISKCSNDTEVEVYTNTSLGWDNLKSKNRDIIACIKNECALRNINLVVHQKADIEITKQWVHDYSLI